MASIYKKPIIMRNPKTGENAKTRSKKWWGRYTDSLGCEKRVPLATDKAVAQSMLDNFEPKIYQPALNGTAAVQTLPPTWSALVEEMKCENCPFPVTLSPDGTRLAAGNGKSIALFEMATGETAQTTQDSISVLTSAALGTLNGQSVLAAGFSDGIISYFEPGNNNPIESIQDTDGNPINKMVFAGDNLLSLNKSGAIKLWQPGNPEPLRTYKTIFVILTQYNTYRFEYNPTTDLILVDTEKGTGSSSRQPQLTAYDVQTGNERFSITDKPDALAFSGNGRWLALGEGHRAAIYNANNGELLREYVLQETGRSISGIALNTDGSLLSVAESGIVSILNVNSQEVIAQVQEENFTPNLVEFSPGGCVLAVGSVEGDLLLADPATGEVLIRLDGHAGEVNHLAFSQDGLLLLSVGIDYQARIWGQAGALNLPSGEPAAQSCRIASVPATSTPTLMAAPVTPTATPTQVSFTRSLYLSDPMMYGGDVLQLQKRLYELGYTGVGTPDGWFGPKTDEAVRQFQERNNLVVDGIVGSITWTQLFSSNAIGS